MRAEIFFEEELSSSYMFPRVLGYLFSTEVETVRRRFMV